MARFAPFALLAVSGCVQILGLHDRSVADDAGADNSTLGDAGGPPLVAGQCGQLLHPSASCAACMDANCCSQARACAGDPSCDEASNCLAKCSDAACRAQCAVFDAQPDTLFALRSCRVQQCATACGSSCGEAASAVDACQTCEQESCCAQETACAIDTACADLNLCIANCFGAASCPSQCQAQFPLGTADYGNLFACQNQCASPCAPGQSWSCLDGPIAWPKPASVGNISFSVTFVNFFSEQPFAGATVKACSKLDFTCATPLDTGTTDTTGLVALTVPSGLSGFDGYLDVTGGKAGGTGAPVFPAIWYPVPFVVADGWRGRTLLLGSDEFTSIAAATNTTPDPTRGHIAVNAVDCAFGPAADVTFSVEGADQNTVGFYLVGGVPATSATATDQSGIAAFENVPTNVPARLTLVGATAGAASGKTMGTMSFIVRPGTLTTPSSFPPLP
jgi:hypothetical protein